MLTDDINIAERFRHRDEAIHVLDSIRAHYGSEGTIEGDEVDLEDGTTRPGPGIVIRCPDGQFWTSGDWLRVIRWSDYASSKPIFPLLDRGYCVDSRTYS